MENDKQKTVGLPVSNEMHAAIQKLADAETTEVSKIIRMALFERYPVLKDIYRKEQEDKLFKELGA